MTIIDRRYSVAEGTAVKAPCRAATTANITLSGQQTIDGVACVQDDRVLVKNQTTGTQNGIYTVSTGNWTRTRDFDGAYDIVDGTRIFINSGTAYALFEFAVSTPDPIVIDTTAIAFTPTGAASASASAIASAASAVTSSASATAAAASAATAAGFNWSTGDIKLTLKTVADSGWRLFDDGTIGDASSGATYANVAALALFTLLYNSPFTDANCPILTSAGAGTTRAAQTSAATAWAAHCRISLPKTLGRALAISGSGSGLTTRVLGAVAGSETHSIVVGEIPTLTSVNAAQAISVASTVNDILRGGVSDNFSSTAGSGEFDLLTKNTITSTGNNSISVTYTNGSQTALSLMQPEVFLNAMVKL